MFNLDGKPFPVSSDIQLNTRTGTVLIPNEVCPVGVSWPDCSCDLLELIGDIVHVPCLTINLHGCCKYPANIARITFKVQHLPDSVYIHGAFCKVTSYILPPYQWQNCWRFGHPAMYCRSTARCPLCASPGHTHTNCSSTKHICETPPMNIMLSSEAILSTNLNWRLLPSASNMA